jgi:hypothetical protein
MAGGAMAQIQASLSAIPSADGLMSPILAEGTNTFAAVKAKAGQLLGDVRIPNPLNSMSSEEPINTANIDKIAEKQKTAYAELQNAVNDVRANELSLASVVETYGDTPGQESKVSAARAKLDAALAALSIAQDKYSASQSSTTA